MPVPENLEFFVRRKDPPEDPQLGTEKMAGFICETYGHIFFVSKSDLVRARQPER